VIKLFRGNPRYWGSFSGNDQAAKSVIEAFRQLEANILVQEYIKEASGAISLFCHRWKSRSLDEATGRKGIFVLIFHRGGKAEKIKLTPEERSTAIRPLKPLGLRVAGVDLLRSNHHGLWLSRSIPLRFGRDGGSHRCDVAKKIIDFVAKNATLVLNRDQYQY